MDLASEGAEKVPEAPNYPRGVGDSNLAIVRGIGSQVSRFKVGDRVAATEYHQSEWINDESGRIVVVPDGVSSEDAVWAHLYTLSGLCYWKANFQPGENVAVVGVGVLGLSAIGLGPLMGARVVAVANSPVRLEMAEKMGAHAGFLSDDPDLQAKLDEFTSGAGIDLVILTANPWPAYRTSVEIVRPNGRVSVVSLLGRGEEPLDFNPLAMQWFYSKGLSIIAVNLAAGYQYPSVTEDRFTWNRSCAYVLSLMENAGLEPSKLITHRLHYTEMQTAYELAFQRDKSMMGVIFDWQD